MPKFDVRRLLVGATCAAALAATAPAHAQRVQTGGANGITWTATSTIIGQTSTATVASNGNPIYTAQMPKYSGVVALIMNEGAAGNFICSGSLIGARSILTAGHCVSNGTSITSLATTAYFYSGVGGNPATYDPDTVVTSSPLSTQILIDRVDVNPLYTGNVIDDHDIAVLHLSQDAPGFAQIYQLSDLTDLTGVDLNVAGYGRRSDAGGSVGADLGTGRLRQGDNRYDYRLGDAAFGGTFTDPSFFGSTANYSYVADFDNGSSSQDASCILAQAVDPTLTSSKYCNLGRGATEASTAGGDSGGPQFVNGKIASVTSYGLSFGSQYGDIDDTLNDTFGEFSGYVPVFYNRQFINDAVAGVPEPATWGMMILGFGAIGAAMRRRPRVATAVTYA